MPGQRGSEKRTLDGTPVLVRLPAELRLRVENAAEAAGLSAAAYLRRLAVDATDGVPELARPSAPRRSIPPAPPEAVREVARLREVLGEIHGTLRQAAGLKRKAGAGEADLARVDALIGRIAADARGLDAAKKALLGGRTP